MNYQAVAFDMDGTLLNNQREILPETLAVLAKIRQKGIKVILVTGRHHSVIYPYYHQLDLNTPAICCNGTYLYDFKQQHYLNARPMTKAQAKTLLSLVNKHKIHTLLYTDEYMTYEEQDDHLTALFKWIDTLPEFLHPTIQHVTDFHDVIENSKEIFKFATSSHNLEALRAFSDEVLTLNEFECEWSWINRADVSLKGNSKGNGLANWAKNEAIPLENIIVFGDSYNDLSMFKRAGLSIAMGNANDEIKAQADRVIGDNNHPSIAEELTRIFLTE